MSTFRAAQNRAHPNKTNTLMTAIIAILVLVVCLQIWLLTASLNTALGGDRSIVWPAFYGSLVLFLAGAWLLRYLPDPLRVPIAPPRRLELDFADAAIAWRTLWISVAALTLSFAVWFMWSAIAVKLSAAGFNLTKRQLFWLTASPVILGAVLRIPYGMLVSRFGSRRSYAAVTLLLLIPALGAGFVLRDPSSSYGSLLFWAAVTGIAGANFATSMAAVTLWFPKQLQGTALGINGLGNLGVTLAQFLVPVVIALGWLGSSYLPERMLRLEYAAWVWVPLILGCTAAIWYGTRDYPAKPQSLASQLRVCRDRHTWAISYLYFLTFGAFVAMGASLPLIIAEVFADAPGGAPNPLVYAPFAPLIATVMRPLGGWAADKLGAGRVTSFAVALMALGGFGLNEFLAPDQFGGFFMMIMIICAASGLGNGSVFKIIPSVNAKEAGAVIGVVSCVGALGGFFPPLLLGACIDHFGSPAWAYTAMALVALSCLCVNGWLYHRPNSPSHC